MNLFKKTIATIALFTLVSGVFSTGVSAYSPDQVEAANALALAEIINDHSADTAAYNLDQNVLRQEIAAIARGIAGLPKKTTCDNVFADVTATTPNTWACYSIEALADDELISKNTTFRPEANISKAEAVGMMVKAAFGDEYSYDASKGTSWQEQVVEFANDSGVIAAFTNYDTAATRGFVFEAAASAMSITEDDSDSIWDDLGLDDLDDTEEDDTEEDDTTVVISGDNKLSVELSPESPVTPYVAAGRERTEVLAFDVTAGSEDVTLKKVKVEYIGLSDSDDFDKLATYLNNEKVTKGDTKDFGSDNEVELAFENGTVIKAGETQTLFVTAEISASTGTVLHKIAITEIEATSGVEGDYVSSISFGVVDSSNVATLDLDISTNSSNVVIGEEEVLAEFSLEEDGDKEDVMLKALTIEFDNFDAEDDLSDVTLYADGEVIASDIVINSDDEAIMNLDFIIPADEKVEFELRGVVTGSIGDAVDAVITDIYAVGSETELVVDFTSTGDAMTVEVSDDRTIEGSEINISFDKSDIDEAMPSAKDVLVGTLKISSVSDYTIDELQITVVSTGSGVEEIIAELEVDGATSDTESGATTTVEYTFEDIALNADGEIELPITFEVNDETALNGSDLTFTVSVIQVTDEENDEEYTSGGTMDLDTILSSNSFDNKTIDIESASMTLTQTKLTGRELVLGNGQEVILYKGKLSVGDSDDVTLEDMTLTGSLTDSGSTVTTAYDFEDIIDSIELNIGGATFDGDVNASDIEFDSINAVIAAGSDNVEVTITAVLKDSDDVDAGDILTLDNVTELTAEDSESEDLLAANITTNTAADTTITLNENGTLTFIVLNNGENKDEIEDVVLAGTNAVAIAEIEIEADEEDIKIQELVLTATGDLTTTLADVRIMNGSSVVADGATITASGSTTIITFENDFTIEDTVGKMELVLVADLEKITTEGGEVSAEAMDITLALTSIDAKGVNSNDDITATTTNTEASDAVTVVPVLVVVSIDDELGTNDSDAVITYSVDKGNNILEDDDVVVYSIEIETAVASGITIRNDDNESLSFSGVNTGTTIYLDLTTDDDIEKAKIGNGDEFEFSVENDNDEIRINNYGITYWVDLDDSGDTTNEDSISELFEIANDKVIDLGEYDAD